MTWDSFIYFAIPALLLWAGGAWTAWNKRPLPTYLLTFAGLAVYFAFILGLWLSLERPPLRTMGETRLWYAFFLPTAGLIVYSRWRYPWILAFSTVLAGVFTTINLVKPDIHNKTLMLLVVDLFGALWAKEAWGHYWAWDPKETWAAATWFAYLAYIHLRLRADRYHRTALWGLVISFVLLQMCWWGINYLPSAQGVSVHTYSMG